MDGVGDPDDTRISLSVNGAARLGSSDRFLPAPSRGPSRSSPVPGPRSGDAIATGIPEKVGPIVPGDRFNADIGRVGKLDHDVVQG
ncbi:MAG: hypothetical protein L0Z54_05680 [Thermoplasmata archaeon]|nr:hypothetical protein [Thermoplasmata archaeon]